MKFISIPGELSTATSKVNELLSGSDHITVSFEKADRLHMERKGDCLTIGYREIRDAMRGMSMAKRVWETGETVCQSAKYETLTVMVDCSRNSVPNMKSLKELMVYLSMMGFNAMMLYTEDTYEIPGQPYFGHMRGRYSVSELQELDAFGRELGIELIPCIQTLAHLNGIFRWSKYAKVHDIDDILLADSEDTYMLIEQMLSTSRSCFKSRYINIGMDEAHHLGRGKYLDKYGYSEKPDIMLRHLAKVVELCKKYDFQPIMWSDMFFRMQFNGQYNVAEGELSQEVLDKIPEEVALCYWNYYTPPKNEKMLEHMMVQHCRVPNDIWFAGGSWAWSGPTPKNYFSNLVTPMQLHYAQKHGVKNVIATVWGDDGGECPVWDLLPSLLQYAELCYSDVSEENMNARSMDCFGISYDDFLKIDQVALPEQIDVNRTCPPCVEKIALYNDVLMGLLDADLKVLDLGGKYVKDLAVLEGVPANRFDYLFDTQRRLASLLSVKYDLSVRIKEAYRSGDKQTLAKIAQDDIPKAEKAYDEFAQALRFQWHKINKPFGFEAQDVRLGGVKERLKTAAVRIGGYLDGSIDALEELEQDDLPYGHTGSSVTDRLNAYGRISTAGRLTW